MKTQNPVMKGFCVFCTASVYLLKYMSVNDIIKGTPIKNRNRRNNKRKRI